MKIIKKTLLPSTVETLLESLSKGEIKLIQEGEGANKGNACSVIYHSLDCKTTIEIKKTIAKNPMSLHVKISQSEKTREFSFETERMPYKLELLANSLLQMGGVKFASRINSLDIKKNACFLKEKWKIAPQSGALASKKAKSMIEQKESKNVEFFKAIGMLDLVKIESWLREYGDEVRGKSLKTEAGVSMDYLLLTGVSMANNLEEASKATELLWEYGLLDEQDMWGMKSSEAIKRDIQNVTSVEFVKGKLHALKEQRSFEIAGKNVERRKVKLRL